MPATGKNDKFYERMNLRFKIPRGQLSIDNALNRRNIDIILKYSSHNIAHNFYNKAKCSTLFNN